MYFGDFAAIPLLVALFFYLALTSQGVSAVPGLALYLAVGLATWTLAEYLIHRFVYHHAPLLSPLHDAHHRQPDALIGVPSFVSSGFVVLVCYLPLMEFAPAAAAGFTSGVLIGYAGYMFVHHATHHMDIGPDDWLYRARVRHLGHHYHADTNFGVVTGFWDRVFGTASTRRDRLAGA